MHTLSAVLHNSKRRGHLTKTTQNIVINRTLKFTCNFCNLLCKAVLNRNDISYRSIDNLLGCFFRKSLDFDFGDSGIKPRLIYIREYTTVCNDSTDETKSCRIILDYITNIKFELLLKEVICITNRIGTHLVLRVPTESLSHLKRTDRISKLGFGTSHQNICV